MTTTVEGSGSAGASDWNASAETRATTAACPLAVTLDRVLLKTSLLSELLLAFLRDSPFNFLFVLAWSLRGRAYLTARLDERVMLDAELLPYNDSVLAYVRRREQQGSQLFLICPAGELQAHRVAAFLGMFSGVVSAANDLVPMFGAHRFDVAVAPRRAAPAANARQLIVIGGTPVGRRWKAGGERVETVPVVRRPLAQVFLRAIRVHQWVKNVLVFTPVLTSHRLTELDRVDRTAVAFLAFSVCASSVYVLNDLLDVRSDRQHGTKRKRAFAAGDLDFFSGLLLTGLLLALAVLLCLFLPPSFRMVLAVYYVLTLGYSLMFKSLMLVDVFVLGGLYTLRVLAGGAASAILPSPWLLAFCLFFFVSLALVKRFSELHALQSRSKAAVPGRGYLASDLNAIGSLGTSSGFMCVLVLALYINSEQVRQLYRTPSVLWFLCPILMYWISRIWLMTYRGNMEVDPVLFALRDRTSYVVAAGGAVVLLLAAQGIHLF